MHKAMRRPPSEEPWANLRGDTSLIEEGEQPPQGISTTTRHKGSKGARGLPRALSGEVAICPCKVLITPATMVSSRAAGKAAVHDLIKGGACKRLIRGSRGKVL